MKPTYPRATPFKNLGRMNRVCCVCGAEIVAEKDEMILVIARGRYLCQACEVERAERQRRRELDADLIERMKRYSIDYEGERE